MGLIAAAGAVALTATGVYYLAPAPVFSFSAPPSPAPAAVAHDSPALIDALETQPMRLPVGAVEPSFRCPAAPAPSGPVSLHTPARTPSGISLLTFTVADSYAGVLLVRGERLDGGARMAFADPDGPGALALARIHVPVRQGTAEASVTAFSSTGCWAIEVDGYHLSEVFLANLR